jgi:hypothetical protein
MVLVQITRGGLFCSAKILIQVSVVTATIIGTLRHGEILLLFIVIANGVYPVAVAFL